MLVMKSNLIGQALTKYTCKQKILCIGCGSVDFTLNALIDTKTQIEYFNECVISLLVFFYYEIVNFNESI